ncbi:MAG TPA: glycosyltransferase family 4 protein [Azospirillum sp.]
MRIALLSYEYPPETGFGGIGTYTYHHARALAELGHDVHVFAGTTAPTELHSRRDGDVTVWRGGDGRPPELVTRALDRLRLHWSRNRLETACAMASAFRAVARRHPFDVIEMPECGAEGMLLNHLVRTPTVVRFHSPARLIMRFYDTPRLDRWLCPKLEGIGIAGASVFTSCSRFLADEVRRTLTRRTVKTIPNGIDLALFDRERTADARGRLGLPAGRTVILFSGRMERRKGIHLCPQVIGGILERHAVTVLFSGRDLFNTVRDELEPDLRRRTLKGDFRYLGALDQSEVRACLFAADILFMPSQWEACPYAALEAMAAGLPIVGADAGGLPDLVVHGETGLLCGAGDTDGYLRNLERLIGDPSLRQRFGAAARWRVEAEFRHTDVARRAVAVYGDVMHAVG